MIYTGKAHPSTIRTMIAAVDAKAKAEQERHDEAVRANECTRRDLQALCPHPADEIHQEVGAFAEECRERCGVCGATSEGRCFRRSP